MTASSPSPASGSRPPLRHQDLRDRLDCRFAAVDDVFDDCVGAALRKLSPLGLEAYLAQAGRLGKLGRGVEPVLTFLEVWPTVASLAGEAAIGPLDRAIQAFQKSPNGRAIVPMLQTLGAVARRLPSGDLLADYLALVVDLMQRTSVSIHGHHVTGPSPGLPTFLSKAPYLLELVPVEGLRRWVDEGVRLHGRHPQRQIDFFALATPDSRALLQRERRGTLLVDVERRLALTLRSLWDDPVALVPYAVGAQGPAAITQPYGRADGLRLPEVLDDWRGPPPGRNVHEQALRAAAEGPVLLTAIEHYRAMVAHLAAHRRWSQALVADNLSPIQRLAVECFEDGRVDYLTLRRLPGLRRAFLALHPAPGEDDCDPTRESCLRHRLACLSRALLDDVHPYRDAVMLQFRDRFRAALCAGESSTREMATMALEWTARTRRPDDQQARVRFVNTVVPYRDDNRLLWTYIEAGDEEESFDQPSTVVVDGESLPPRHYPEWEEAANAYRPDWASVYDTLQPAGDVSVIDALLRHYAPIARHLKRLLDLLKPQDRTRLRYQEDGSELDLDVALRALIDLRAGARPDPRFHMRTHTDGRDIAVLLLIDLSQSVNDVVPGADATVLDVSRAAVALLSWAIAALGDEFAIAGFHSNTRHEVRYVHIKGFAEAWDDAPKARLASVEGAYSTRMGAALRHGGHLLSGRRADKKLLLILTDGQPADVDVDEPDHLIADAARAVRELDALGLHTHCVSLDAKADEYVARIFGARWTIIDQVAQLPRRLPELFLSLTR